MKGLLGWAAIPIASFLLMIFISSEPRKPREEACYRLELLMRDNAHCRAFPLVWEEWDELNIAYGSKINRKGTVSCRMMPAEIGSYGIYDSYDGRFIIYIMTTAYRENQVVKINDVITAELGADFCQIAEKNAWIDRYLNKQINGH